MKTIETLKKYGYLLIYVDSRLHTDDSINIQPLTLSPLNWHTRPKLDNIEHISLYTSLKNIILGKDFAYYYFPAKSFYIYNAKYIFYKGRDIHILI